MDKIEYEKQRQELFEQAVSKLSKMNLISLTAANAKLDEVEKANYQDVLFVGEDEIPD